MTDRELNTLPAELADQLRFLDRKVRGLAALRGAGLVCVVLCGGIAAGVLIDWLFELAVGPRVAILLGVAGAALIAAVSAIVWPLIRRTRSAELAALVDSSFPHLRERIESAVELTDPDLPESQKGSELMRSLLMKETVRKADNVNFGAAADGASAFHWVFVGTIALLLVILPFGLSRDGYALMLSRFLTPWKNLDRATNLYFEVENGDRTVARGDDVTIRAVPKWRLSPGELPDHAWLNWRNVNGEADQRRMEWSPAEEAYVATLPHVFTSFDYDVSARRARTRRYQIDVVERPDVTDLTLEIIPPAYTGRPARTLDGAIGRTEVFEQSELTFDAAFNKPLETAELVWLTGPAGDLGAVDMAEAEDSERLPLTLSEDGTTGRLTFAAQRSGPYALVLRDQHGLESQPGLARELVVIADTPPEVAWRDLDPSRLVNIPPIEARPDDDVPLPVRATDDIGVAELELRTEIIQRGENLPPVPVNSPQLGQPVVSHDFDLSLEDLELQHGDLLSVRARGVDARAVPGPQEGFSPARLIRINRDADPTGLQALLQEQQKLRNAIEEIRQEVQQDRQQVRELENEAAEKQKEGMPFERQGDIASLVQSEREIQQRIEQLAAAFEGHPLQRNIAEQTQQIASEPIESARSHLQQAQQAGQENPGQQRNGMRQAIGDLSRADERLEELLRKFEELAALERDLQQLQRLAEQAERLTQNVEQFEQDRDELQRLEKEQALNEQQVRQQQHQLAEQQMDLQDEQQDLSSALDHLLEERPEILEAARRQQLDQLQQLADRAGELAESQQQLAEALSRETQEEARSQQPDNATAPHDAAGSADMTDPQDASPDGEQPPEASPQQQSGAQQPPGNPSADSSDTNADRESMPGEDNATASSEPADPPDNQQSAETAPQESDGMPSDSPREDAPPSSEPGNQSPQAPSGQHPEGTSAQTPPKGAQKSSQSTEPPGDQPDSPPAPPVPADTPMDGTQQPSEGTPPDTNTPESPQSMETPQSMSEEPNNRPGQQNTSDTAEHDTARTPSPARRQQQLAEQAARQAVETARQQGVESETAKQAREFARQSLEAAEQARWGLLEEASETAAQAAESARQTTEQMQQSTEPAGERMRKQSEELAQQQSEIAEELQQAAESPPQRQAARQQGQQELASQTSQLAEQMAQAAERMASEPLNQQEAGEQARQAAEDAQAAQQSQQQAQSQMQQQRPRDASEPAQQAAESLQQASEKACQACQGNQPQSSPVPGEVGQQVADARSQLNQAARQLQQAGEQQHADASPQQNGQGEGEQGQDGQQPGEGRQPGEQPGQGEQPGEGEGQQPGEGEGETPEGEMPGEQGEGDNPGQEGQPGQNGQDGQPGQEGQPSEGAGSEAMRRVAESLQQAAEHMGMQSSQRSQNQGQNQQSGDSPEGAEGEQGGYGPRGGLSLAELEAELGRISQRNWGQLPDRVETELQSAQQKKPDADYARLIRLYFDEVARRQSAADGLNDGNAGTEAE